MVFAGTPASRLTHPFLFLHQPIDSGNADRAGDSLRHFPPVLPFPCRPRGFWRNAEVSLRPPKDGEWAGHGMGAWSLSSPANEDLDGKRNTADQRGSTRINADEGRSESLIFPDSPGKARLLAGRGGRQGRPSEWVRALHPSVGRPWVFSTLTGPGRPSGWPSKSIPLPSVGRGMRWNEEKRQFPWRARNLALTSWTARTCLGVTTSLFRSRSTLVPQWISPMELW